jgi:hypothetical protein
VSFPHLADGADWTGALVLALSLCAAAVAVALVVVLVDVVHARRRSR